MMADGPLTIGRPREEVAFLTCEDFINAGLWNHGSCCQACHKSGDCRSNIRLHPSGSTKEAYSNIHLSVCCGFAGNSFTKEDIEKVIQCAYKGGDDC